MMKVCRGMLVRLVLPFVRFNGDAVLKNMVAGQTHQRPPRLDRGEVFAADIRWSWRLRSPTWIGRSNLDFSSSGTAASRKQQSLRLNAPA
jgi:hypothetical protein